MKPHNLTTKSFFGVALIVLISSGTLFGQARYNTTQGLGMGNTGTAKVWGYQANFVNPANLAMPSRTSWTIGLFGGFSPNLSGDLANIALYNEYFTDGGVLTAERNMEAATRWFGSGDDTYKQLGIGIDVTPFGISHQRGKWGAALAIRSRVLVDVGMSKGVFLSTTGINSTNFGSFQQFDLANEVLGYAEVSAGFGYRVWENSERNEAGTIRVFAGIAPKYLVPIHYHSIALESQLRVQDNPYLITHDFSYEIHALGQFAGDLIRFQQQRQQTGQAPEVDGFFDNSFDDAGGIRGFGFGMDIGATAEYYLGDFPFQSWFTRGSHKVTASIALTDLGSISLTDAPARLFNSGIFEWDGLDVDQNRLENEFDSDFGEYFNNVVTDSIGNTIYLDLGSEELSSISADLPTMVNFGLAYDVGKLSVAMDIGKGMNDRANNSSSAFFGLGAEFRLLNALPIQVGMRSGGSTSSAYTFGTGLNLRNFEFTLSLLTVPNSEANGSGLSMAMSGFVIRF